MRTRSVSTCLLFLALGLLGACSSSNPTSIFAQITVSAFNAGGGNGRVTASDPAVQIDCQFTAATSVPGPCTDVFPDAGAGGTFTLDAAPSPGSTFGGWTGCTSANGTACTLTFATGGDTTFSATAHFDLANLLGVNLLVNPDFESPVTVGTLPSTTGHWQGDSAYAVIADQGISPRTGTQMLRFQRSGLLAGPGVVSSQQWQLVDLTPLAADIDAGKVRADASVWFNRVSGDAQTDTRFDLRLLSFPGTPAGYPTDYASPAHVAGDSLITTGNAWQLLNLIDVLPVGTRYVAVEIYAFENVQDDATDPEFDGHYADEAFLMLSLIP